MTYPHGPENISLRLDADGVIEWDSYNGEYGNRDNQVDVYELNKGWTYMVMIDGQRIYKSYSGKFYKTRTWAWKGAVNEYRKLLYRKIRRAK